MTWRLGKVTTKCKEDPNTKAQYCESAVRIRTDLIAVWLPYGGISETFVQKAEREGEAIIAFVNYALGPTEFIEALEESACDHLSPDSPQKTKDLCP